MPTTDPDRVVQTLDDDQCRRFVATARIGRLGFTRGALPAIQPVVFRLHDDHVVIPARSAIEFGPRPSGSIVVFEVDSYDETDRTGWSVSVVGPSRLVADPVGVGRYDALPWHRRPSAPDRCYIAVRLALVQGWRTIPVTAPALRSPAS